MVFKIDVDERQVSESGCFCLQWAMGPPCGSESCLRCFEAVGKLSEMRMDEEESAESRCS